MAQTRLEDVSTEYRLEVYADRTGGPDSCWTWQRCLNQDGYGMVFCDIKRRMVSAHRAAYIRHSGPIPSGMEVRHLCDVRSCVNPRHLSAGSHQANMHDMVERGRTPIGERHPRHKMTDEQVGEAFKLRGEGWLLREIADKFGVSQPFMSRLMRGVRGAGRVDVPVFRARRLTIHEIRAIRAARASGVPCAGLSAKYGITESTVSRIGRGTVHGDKV